MEDKSHPLSFYLHGFLIAFDGMFQRFSGDLNWKLEACLVRCRCRSDAAMVTELLIAELLGSC